MNQQVPIKIRSLAAICVKNGITKFWRKTAPGAIDPLEKAQMRANQLLCFGEAQKQVFYLI